MVDHTGQQSARAASICSRRRRISTWPTP